MKHSLTNKPLDRCQITRALAVLSEPFTLTETRHALHPRQPGDKLPESSAGGQSKKKTQLQWQPWQR